MIGKELFNAANPPQAVDRPTVRKSRLSLAAVVLLFILGLFTVIFVDPLVGLLIIILSVILYVVLVTLTARFGRSIE